jgi:ubiquinone/menaquinone biosynthesis C-methylase UbiE
MNEFDAKAREWDNNLEHTERAEVITRSFLESVPVSPDMTAMEYGAGTGLMSFLLSKHFSHITLLDNSREMVNVMREKLTAPEFTHMNALSINLEVEDYNDGKFDCIYSQMVMHHVKAIDSVLSRFFRLLNPGGYLAIADLYEEDGSFHGDGFDGHNGFNVEELAETLSKFGFHQIKTRPCYVRKKLVNDIPMEFPIFLMTAIKPE